MDNDHTSSVMFALMRSREESWGRGQRDHTLVCDLIAPIEIQRGELGATLGQRDHTLVRDLIALPETQRGELGVLLGQRDHTLVRDLFALREIQLDHPWILLYQHLKALVSYSACEISIFQVRAPLKQGRDTLVRDLIAPKEIQRGELGAPLGQRDHTLVRDLITRRFQIGELGHPLDNAITPSSVI